MLLRETDYAKRTTNALAKRKLVTTNDLCTLVPLHYRDYRNVYSYTACPLNEFCAVRAKINRVTLKKSKGKEYVSVCMTPADDSYANGNLYVLFFHQPWRMRQFVGTEGQIWVMCGKPSSYGANIYLTNPEISVPELRFEPFIKTVYSSIKGVSDENLRMMIRNEVGSADELLEADVVNRFGLPGYSSALANVHYPKTGEDIVLGKKRLLFNDLFYFAMSLESNNAACPEKTDIRFSKAEMTQRLLQNLPFTPTEDQQEIICRLHTKAANGDRADYLLQGDVGSGKTVVAAALLALAAENGYQAVLAAPREVLAEQHFRSISRMMESFGITPVFLHSGMKAAERKKTLKAIESGEALVIVGTHSCLSDSVVYAKLGAVVTDEEHLFGVDQKEALTKNAARGVHCLAMSATPIPRSLAGVLYGERREIFSIRSMPAGRLPVKTSMHLDRREVFAKMEEEIRAGHRCYVVCPSIDSDEMTSLAEVESVYRARFADYKIAVVHGKQKKEENDAMIEAFRDGAYQILLSTTVIEVGVDVSDATVIVVEESDRFGLASLHQLRGRVGRSSLQSYCFLMTTDMSNERLRAMVATTDGFKIAEMDLQLRGSGNLIGTEQSGANRYVNTMIAYPKLYAFAQKVAKYCIENGYGKRLMDTYREHEEGLL